MGETNRSSRRYKMHPNRWQGRPTRVLTGAAAAALLFVASAGCSNSQADPIPEASTSATPSQTPTTTPVKPGGPPAGWEKKFTQQQLNAYDAALARYQRYNELVDDIYRKGKDTPQARAVLKEYNLLWQRDIVTLGETFDKGGVRQEVPPKTLWSYARSIKPDVDVVIVQCTDYSRMRFTKNGKPLQNRPKHLVTPLIVKMTKPANRDWMVVSEQLRDKASCAG